MQSHPEEGLTALAIPRVANHDLAMEMELHADPDGYIACPQRGQISAEWCEGCPYRFSVDSVGNRIVVECAAAPQIGAAGTTSSALRDVPDLWR